MIFIYDYKSMQDWLCSLQGDQCVIVIGVSTAYSVIEKSVIAYHCFSVYIIRKTVR